MAIPALVSNGTFVASASNVGTPTILTPGLPATRATGDWLFVFTSSVSTSTSAVSGSAGWTSLYEVTGGPLNAERLKCYVRKVDGTETAPTITWSGLSTGNSGSPCCALIANLGQGFRETASMLVTDVIGTASSSTSDELNAGGNAISTTTSEVCVISHGVRVASTVVYGVRHADGTGLPLTWTEVHTDFTTSGGDMSQYVALGMGPTYTCSVTAHTWLLPSVDTATSVGVMVALALEQIVQPSEVGALTYTKGRA